MSEVLYELIHGLSISEKIHFKRNAKVHDANEKKNYLKIYEAIEKMDHYDKEVFIAQFKGSTIEKYLSSEVDYLKNKILISLFNSSLVSSKRNKIQKGILEIEVLANKGFQKEAIKKVNFIKKGALLQEEFMFILRLIELEEIIFFKQGVIGYKDKLLRLREERNKVSSLIQNLNDYRLLREEIREFQFSSHLNMNKDQAFKDLCNNPLITEPERCMSFRSKEHWLYFQVLMNYLKRDFAVGLSISLEYVEFMNQHAHLFDVSKILPALSNYIYHAALNRDRQHFDQGIEMLGQLSRNKDVSKHYFKYILYTRSLEFAYYAGDHEMMEQKLAEAVTFIEEEHQYLEEAQIQYLYMVIVRSAIVLQNSKMGMLYSNLWIQRGVLAYRKVQSRLFSIIVHYELGHLDLVQSEVILLKKLEHENLREQLLIRAFCSFLNKLIKYPNRKKDLIKSFQSDLANISKSNRNYFDFISFDYYQWSLRLN